MSAAGPAYSHELPFGDHPRTLDGGDLSVEFSTHLDDRLFEDRIEVGFGLADDFTVTVTAPYLQREVGRRRRTGLGDVPVAVEWRMLHVKRHHAALRFGVELPTGDAHAPVPLGSGATDFLAGLAYAHEAEHWYGWSGIRYFLTTEAGGEKAGNVLSYGGALGFRPWRASEDRPGLRLQAGLYGERVSPTDRDGATVADSGGRTLFAGPGVLLDIERYTFRAGMRLPVWRRLRGVQEEPGWQAMLGFEVHR